MATNAERRGDHAIEPGFHSGATRMDMHVHSHASDMPVVAAAGLIGAAECYSDPEHVYDQARARGMDLVTITDHDTIKGAMELVERGFERFVVGEEVTTRFPEDGCKVHVLVWNLSPIEHDQIEALGLRSDVYEFAAWLYERRLAHSLAHPLYAQNGRLATRHIEIATLLFRCFESLSGAHLGKHRDVLGRYLDGLTGERIATLARRHGVDPVWPHAAEKGRTGGSDDHGLINIGRTWTAVRSTSAERIAEPTEFLEMVMAGRCEAGGVGGQSKHLAHQLTAVAARYGRTRIGPDCDAATRLIASKLGRFAGVAIEPPSRLSLVVRKVRKTLRRQRAELPIVEALREHLRPTLLRYPDLRARLEPSRWTEGPALGEHGRMVQFADDLFESLGRAMFEPAHAAVESRDLPEIRRVLVSYALLGAAQVPDIAAMYVQNKDRRFVERFAHETGDLEHSPVNRPMRVAMFTDTLGDVNGVCRFIQDTAAHASETGRDLEVITSTRQASPGWDNVSNFEPIATMPLHAYESLDLVLPPVTRMLRHLDRRQPDLVHISTPGPVGLTGMLAAKILGVPIVGVHHTDFPAYAERILDDSAARFASRSLRWMYSAFDTVFARSVFYTDALGELGVPSERVALIPPGVDIDTFHPRFQDQAVWSRLPQGERESSADSSVGPSVKVLYVGRLSIEKNMPMLAEIWQRTAAACEANGVNAELILVGDGPYREQMERMLPPRSVT